ncbi:DUF6478 family protein [Dinoroseobacter sp. S375]|uniref:DUF6478 family protein n=1 Tax=Dinoroseobacter sp. S375 TaxID=3415136 RepID=UPI003C7E79D1
MLRRLSDLITGQKDPLAGDAPSGETAEELRARRDAARLSRGMADRDARDADAALRALAGTPATGPAGALDAYRPLCWTRATLPAAHVGPETGTEVSPDLTLFHDCPLAEITLRQTLAPVAAPARFALSLDTLRFQGSFLSLVLTLPEAQTSAIGLRDVLRLTLAVEMSAQTRLYGRLNLQQGPNTAQMLAEVPPGEDGATEIAFDLAYGDLRDLPVERVWIDLMVEDPAMRRVTLHDLILSRHPRAEL